MILLTVISFNSYAADGQGSHSNTTLGNYQGDNSTGNGGFNDATEHSGDVQTMLAIVTINLQTTPK